MADAQTELSLKLRQAAREHLNLGEGDYWDSRIADAQAKALLADGWVKPEIMCDHISIGRDNHRCHSSPIGNHQHGLICPTGEHPMGWQHMPGPHNMCSACGKGPAEEVWVSSS